MQNELLHAAGAAPSNAEEEEKETPDRPPLAFHFSVSFGANSPDDDSAFREVSGLDAEMDVETVVEGGQNAFVHQLPKAVKHPRLVLARGVAPKDSRLLQWCKDILEGGLVQPISPILLRVSLLNAREQPLRVWVVRNAYPVKWSVEAFNATRSEVAIERIELAHAGATRTK
ncbi:phage tail protein [Pelomonas cellulosilytica]|uniref:Phage tail protein n=1 Tax=Pelomonas cellulosilytica TaxID=2906762 RepID=A0ABS8XTV6_9BURK|nr:phage tail protein [Pelomonas sp. P8]MCE4554322.1 phage tail protein [Pelomonas sp. P8]